MEAAEGKLTTGSIPGVLTRLSMPIVAAACLSTAYSLTDMAWIGLLGGEVLAGVGVGSMYVWLSQGLATLAKMGGQVLAGQELGKGNRENAKKYAVAALQLTVLFGLLYGGLCVALAEPMVAFFGLEDAVAIEVYFVSLLRCESDVF